MASSIASSSLNEESDSSRSLPNDYEQLSANFTKGQRYKNDMNDEQFDRECVKFLQDIQLSEREIVSLEEQTIGQSENFRWRIERRYRLTASNFGRVIRLPDTSFRSFLVEQLLRLTPKTEHAYLNNPAMEYGRYNERRAVFAYQNLRNKIVSPCGLFVHPDFGYLAASPDGLIGEDGILEVKCPFSARFMRPLQIPKFLKHFYCTLSSDGSNLVLNTDHSYYYQIQGQLEITDREWCDFVIWTPHGIHVERICRDESVWNEMFPKLEAFYKLSLLPEIVDSRHARGLPIREPDFVLNAIEKGLQ